MRWRYSKPMRECAMGQPRRDTNFIEPKPLRGDNERARPEGAVRSSDAGLRTRFLADCEVDRIEIDALVAGSTGLTLDELLSAASRLGDGSRFVAVSPLSLSLAASDAARSRSASTSRSDSQLEPLMDGKGRSARAATNATRNGSGASLALHQHESIQSEHADGCCDDHAGFTIVAGTADPAN